jgi:hypothetical protein
VETCSSLGSPSVGTGGACADDVLRRRFLAGSNITVDCHRKKERDGSWLIRILQCDSISLASGEGYTSKKARKPLLASEGRLLLLLLVSLLVLTWPCSSACGGEEEATATRLPRPRRRQDHAAPTVTTSGPAVDFPTPSKWGR